MRVLAREILRRWDPRLKEVGIAWESPQVLRWRDGEYASEVQITLLADGELVDCLEFFVYREGRVEVTIAEATEWLEDELEDLVAKRR